MAAVGGAFFLDASKVTQQLETLVSDNPTHFKVLSRSMLTQSFQEVVKIVNTKRKQFLAHHSDNVLDYFRKIDVDKSGEIDSEELIEHLQKTEDYDMFRIIEILTSVMHVMPPSIQASTPGIVSPGLPASRAEVVLAPQAEEAHERT